MPPSIPAVRACMLTLAIALAGLLACASLVGAEARHCELVKRLHAMVGASIHSRNAWLEPRSRLGEEALSSGLTRYRYRVGSDCVGVFDVDPVTGRIVAAAFEGTDDDCVAPLA